MTRPMLKLGGGFAAGLLVASFFSGKLIWILAVLPASISFLFYFKRKFRPFCLFCFSLAVGVAYLGFYQVFVYQPAVAWDGETVPVKAVMYDCTEDMNGTMEYLFRVKEIDHKKVAGYYYLRSNTSTQLPCQYGDICQFTGELVRISKSNQLTIDDQAKTKYFFLSTDFDEVQDFEVVSHNRFSFQAMLFQLRDRIIQVFEEHLQPEQAAVLSGMLLGQKEKIPYSVTESFRLAGYSHMLAVSGLHLSILMALIIGTLSKIRVPRKVSSLLGIVFIFLFALLTGCSPSVVRAGIMMGAILIGKLMDAKADSVNSLGLAAGLILIISPFSILNLSFLLSFSATFGLVLLARPLSKRIFEKIKLKSSLVRFLVEGFSVGVSATIFTIPVIVASFSQFVWVSPISNLLAIPLATVILCFGFFIAILGLLLPQVSFLLAPICYLENASIWGLEQLAKLFSHVPPIPLHYDFVQLWCVLSLVLVLIAVGIHKNKFLALVACASVTCLVAGAVSYQITVSNQMIMAIVDGSYGYSVILQKDGTTVLLNCGGYRGGYHTLSYLQGKGTQKVDLLVLTDANKKEAAGVPFLLENQQVDWICVPEEGTMLGDIMQSDLSNTHVVEDTSIQINWDDFCLILDDQSVFCKWGEVTIAMGNYPPVPEGEIVTFYLKNGKTTRKPVDFSVKYDIILENNQVLLQNGETVYQTESNLVELVCDEKGQVK
ncbi:ComEC/Rec2 family competence protein [Clostridium facile]|uniref:ComEC/Rec2 family competence protein n=1 Tax=Clostridium facile TaxID=2763035 RepID=A0ABR7ISB2_9CLOT|nr:ComEC/Rec2 family competence protein [Clostridium facile]MBC5788035.1 ComEC/Rec2 family competence protein [Clostridium facile]